MIVLSSATTGRLDSTAARTSSDGMRLDQGLDTELERSRPPPPVVYGHPEVRVAVDMSHERHGRAGVARAARRLAEAVSEQPGIDVVYLGGGSEHPRGSTRKRASVLAQDLVRSPLLLRSVARLRRADVLHVPAHRGPLFGSRPPLVVTLHDVAFLREPATLSRWNRLYSRRFVPSLARAADLVICPSADTASDAHRLLGVRTSRLRVVRWGVDPLPADGPRPSGLPLRYVLAVGTPEPRKNLARLAVAVAIVRERGDPDLALVLAGGSGWGEAVPEGRFVRVLGRVPDEALGALYREATVVAVPSLHEGFGIVALEAMSAGVPVVASTAGALPEVCGDAAVLVDPRDPFAIAEGIVEADGRRVELSALGRRRAAAFTWEQAAAETAACYRELA